MESTFEIEIPFIQDGERRTRLLIEAERRQIAKAMEENPDEAAGLDMMLQADQVAREHEGLTHWTATVREPSYRERLGIRAVALRDVREFASAHGLEPTGEMVSIFTRDAQARIALKSITDAEGNTAAAWEDLDDEWRQDLARLIEEALSVTEAERVPLFGPRPAAT